MNIKQFYTDKTIFLSGTTGFLGKVVLEKLLRSTPGLKRVYVMVRAKKTVTIQQRLENEIFASEIFTRIRNNITPQQFEELKKKVVPVAGDLIMNHLGLSAEHRASLVNECDVIINCAASVNFDDPLLDAIQINYQGCMRMLALAHECKKLQTFTHVSTAYVNCNRSGQVAEQIYDLPNNQDPEEVINKIMNMNPQYIEENEMKIIGDYPNTYTYTKSMAERTLKKNRGNLRVSILRPSVIISCYEEPVQGWTDTLSAAGGLTYAVSNGIMHYVRAKDSAVVDLIPADFCSNLILACTVQTAREEVPRLNIFHSASSSTNPLLIKDFAGHCIQNAKYLPYYKQLADPYVTRITNQNIFDLIIYFTEVVPIKALGLYAEAPVVGSKPLRDKAKWLKEMQQKMYAMQKLFFYFINNEWFYESSLNDAIWKKMDAEEKVEFNFETRQIDWFKALSGFYFGLRRYYIKEDVVSPETGFKQLLAQNQIDWFHDIRAARRFNKYQTKKDNSAYFPAVLSAQKFKAFVDSRVKTGSSSRLAFNDKKESLTRDPQRILQATSGGSIYFDVKAAHAQLEMMRTKVTNSGLRSMLWFFSKTMRVGLQGLYVQEESMMRVKSLADSGAKIVLVPIYKSFADFFIQAFINNRYELDTPFTFGNQEDSPRIKLFDTWLRSAGYIIATRRSDQNIQQSYINSALLKECIEHNSITTIFQNADRLRSGKFSRPQSADLSMLWLLDAYMNLAVYQKNLTIVPVMVSYDRIFEYQNLATEMVAGEPRRLSFNESMKKIWNLDVDQLGTVYVKYLEPINLHSYLKSKGCENLDVNNLESTAFTLTEDLLTIQQQNTPRTLNSIISTCLLQEKAQLMPMKDLLEKSTVIYDYIKQKKTSTTYMNVKPQQPLVEKHIAGLGFEMNKKGDKKKCEVKLARKDEDLRVMLGLAHYSMQLSSVFILEGIVAQTIKNHFYVKKSTEPLKLKDMILQTKQLASIFQNEHFIDWESSKDKMLEKLYFFSSKGAFHLNESKDELLFIKNDNAFTLLNFFSQMIQSYLDTYIIVLLTIETMSGKHLTLKKKQLISELHQAIKNLYQENVIPDLHACLIEVIKTAMDRFAQMGFVEMRAYGNKDGRTSEFLQSLAEAKPRVEEQLAAVMAVRPFTEKEISTIDTEIQEAVQRAQGPLVLSRL